jgi:glycine betaine/choline ABC-type transport system substrate-binding protein
MTRRLHRSGRLTVFRAALLMVVGAVLVGCGNGAPVSIGSKGFTEQRIIAEMVAQLLEAEGVPVDRVVEFPDGVSPFTAIQEGVVDTYVEYTGTALLALGEPPLNDSEAAFDLLQETSSDLDLEWLAPLGYSNDYVLAVTPETASRYDLRTISDLANLPTPPRFGVDREFLRRPLDGFNALVDRYGLTTNPDLLVSEDKSQLYQALRSGEIDVMEGFATDSQIRSFDLVILEDDLDFLPAYDAAILARTDVVEQHPELVDVLSQLDDALDADTVSTLIEQVDFEGRDAKVVASEQLARLGLLDNARPSRGDAVVVAIGPDDQRSGPTGRALEAIGEAYPGRPIQVITANDPAGAVLNGDARMAIANAEELFAPEGRTDGRDRPIKPLEAIASVETRSAHLLVPAGATLGNTLAVGPPGSTSQDTALTLIANGVLPADTTLVVAEGDSIADRVEMVTSGQASAVLAISPLGHPEIQDAISDSGLQLLSLPNINESLQFSTPHLRPTRIPAGEYRDQTETIDTLSQQTVVAGPASDIGDPAVYGPNAYIGGPRQPVSGSAVTSIRETLDGPRIDPALPRAPSPLTELDGLPQSTNPSTVESLLNFVVIIGIGLLVAFLLRRRPESDDAAVADGPSDPTSDSATTGIDDDAENDELITEATQR